MSDWQVVLDVSSQMDEWVVRWMDEQTNSGWMDDWVTTCV